MEGGGAAVDKMEKEFDSKMRIQSNSSSPNNESNSSPQRSKSFAFRAPQENFSIQDFELGKIYGVGSYSKVHSSFTLFFFRLMLLSIVWIYVMGFFLCIVWTDQSIVDVLLYVFLVSLNAKNLCCFKRTEQKLSLDFAKITIYVIFHLRWITRENICLTDEIRVVDDWVHEFLKQFPNWPVIRLIVTAMNSIWTV